MSIARTLLPTRHRRRTALVRTTSIRPSATLHPTLVPSRAGQHRRMIAGVGGGCLLAAAAGLGTVWTSNADAAAHGASSTAADAAAQALPTTSQRLTSATTLGRQLAGTGPFEASRSSVRRPPVRPSVTKAAAPGATGASFTGIASWYGPGFQGRATASGQLFEENLLTAASRTLPLMSHLRVCRGSRCVIVLVNDRGPVPHSRVLDLSEAAAARIGLLSAGVGTVTATPIR